MKMYLTSAVLLLSFAALSQVRPGTGGKHGPDGHDYIQVDELVREMPKDISNRIAICSNNSVKFTSVVEAYNYFTLKRLLEPQAPNCIEISNLLTPELKCVFKDTTSRKYLEQFVYYGKQVHKEINTTEGKAKNLTQKELMEMTDYFKELYDQIIEDEKQKK